MEHILISPGKLKLMLTQRDMLHYELTQAVESGTVDTTEANFRELLTDAGRISGFDAGHDRLFVQLYPSRDGGAEVYITRLGCQSETAADSVKTKEKKFGQITLTQLAAFDTMEDLLRCCHAMMTAVGKAESCAYTVDNRYFLVIRETLAYRAYLDRPDDHPTARIIGEYGQNLSDRFISYLYEHGEVFCGKNAIATLGKLSAMENCSF